MDNGNGNGNGSNNKQQKHFESIPGLIEMDGDIDHHIIAERKQSIHDIHRDMIDLADSWGFLSSIINEQGDKINVIEKETEKVEANTTEGVSQLEKASILIKDRLIIFRDIALVVGGGLLGAGGLFLGPIIGFGTIIAGGAAGGAAAAGFHKISNK